jgi:leukotriene-A4 hydrolase
MVNFGLNTTYSSLYPVMNGANPDDSFSEVPYEKGFQFITFLESLMKTKLDFQNLIRGYILAHKETSITYVELRAYFEKWIGDNYDSTTVA